MSGRYIVKCIARRFRILAWMRSEVCGQVVADELGPPNICGSFSVDAMSPGPEEMSGPFIHETYIIMLSRLSIRLQDDWRDLGLGIVPFWRYEGHIPPAWLRRRHDRDEGPILPTTSLDAEHSGESWKAPGTVQERAHSPLYLALRLY